MFILLQIRFGLLDVARLRFFVTTTEQKNDGLPPFGAIHAIARPSVDLQFEYAAVEHSVIAKVPERQAVKSSTNACASLNIVEIAKPIGERYAIAARKYLDLIHAGIVVAFKLLRWLIVIFTASSPAAARHELPDSLVPSLDRLARGRAIARAVDWLACRYHC
jgi:hypothetical protein